MRCLRIGIKNNCRTTAEEKRGKENEQQWEKEPAAFFCDRRRMNLFQSRFIFIGIKGNAIRK